MKGWMRTGMWKYICGVEGCGDDWLESVWGGMCAGSGKVRREGAVQWVHRFRKIRRVVLWVVLQGFGTLRWQCELLKWAGRSCVAWRGKEWFEVVR